MFTEWVVNQVKSSVYCVLHVLLSHNLSFSCTVIFNDINFIWENDIVCDKLPCPTPLPPSSCAVCRHTLLWSPARIAVHFDWPLSGSMLPLPPLPTTNRNFFFFFKVSFTLSLWYPIYTKSINSLVCHNQMQIHFAMIFNISDLEFWHFPCFILATFIFCFHKLNY